VSACKLDSRVRENHGKHRDRARSQARPGGPCETRHSNKSGGEIATPLPGGEQCQPCEAQRRDVARCGPSFPCEVFGPKVYVRCYLFARRRPRQGAKSLYFAIGKWFPRPAAKRTMGRVSPEAPPPDRVFHHRTQTAKPRSLHAFFFALALMSMLAPLPSLNRRFERGPTSWASSYPAIVDHQSLQRRPIRSITPAARPARTRLSGPSSWAERPRGSGAPR